jgi:hypothetical protein
LLFLDANIFLDFYRFGDDDISEVGKLVTLVADGDIQLLMNQQLRNEIERNREKIVAESLNVLKSTRYGSRVPNYCTSFPEHKVLLAALKSANEAHSALVAATSDKVRNRSLAADQLIARLFREAEDLAVDEEIFRRAVRRVELGNPPGKRGSLGDAIHWETLISSGGYFLDLVSRDSDFASELDPSSIRGTLNDEWKAAHGQFARIQLFPSLGSFFRSQFPDIKLSDEAVKNELIARLEEAPNFSATHSIIAELSKFSFFTTAQVKRLFQALVSNSQVGWIGEDPDVNEFYLKLKDKSHVVDDSIQQQAADHLGVTKDDFFFPF